MYQIKEVTLQHGKHTRRRLVIEFDESKYAILSEFLMSDAPMLQRELMKEVKEVLECQRKAVKGSGNRTSWSINEEQAVIEDLFTYMDQNIPSYPTCIIETSKLYDIMFEWFQAQDNFKKINGL